MMNETTAARFANLAQECIKREYPHNRLYWLEGSEDLKPPRELTPAFYGCLDWHSAVHSHWLLIRLLRYFPNAEFQIEARLALARNLLPEKIQGEIAHLQHQPSFERPYGLVWLLQLAAELYEWNDTQAKEWLAVLAPLERLVADNLQHWLEKLELPNRTGMHNQTAFALGLALDWACVSGNVSFANLVKNKAQEFFLHDQNYPLHFEPLGYDFLSPSLAEADLMRRVLSPTAFSDWFSDFLPQLPVRHDTHWLEPVIVSDPKDYLRSHFQGLNLSRAWMLEGIISSLPDGDRRIDTLRSAAVLHAQSGLVDVKREDYAGAHWLGTFAVYLLTSRGL
jgi:hypothetical protein